MHILGELKLYKDPCACDSNRARKQGPRFLTSYIASLLGSIDLNDDVSFLLILHCFPMDI
jgi:hypothetical protein